MQPVTTPPRVFSGRYELTHVIARGGMAQVYRARDRLLDRPVALKVLFPELSVDRAFVERFRREAQAAANLSHPNIVPVFDWGEDGGTYYIVMEYIDGQPLSAALRAGGPMPPVRVAQIGARVADALDYAHRHGVIHRDVKPGNVLLTSDEQVKVTDFGIARAVNTEESLTQTGAVMGTATYFSPEQAEGMGVDARSDIYSLGVVLYEMVAGRPPFLGDTPVAIASKHVRDNPPPLRDLNPTVPPALEAIIAKAMAKSPDLRYQSAGDLRVDLQRYVDGRPVAATDPAMTALLAADAASTGVMTATGVMAAGAVGATQALSGADGRPPRRGAADSHAARWLLLLVVLLVALGVIVYFVLQSLGYIGVSGFAMPTVRGQSVASATSVLNAKGLDVTATKPKVSTTVHKTDVVSTDPAHGTTVKKGQHVTLLVSTGPVARVAVPTLKTHSYLTAVATLTTLGLHPKEHLVASTSPSGTVLSESPPAGTKVKVGSTVKLTVSNQTGVIVPSVVGDTEATASNKLGADGLSVTTSSACSAQYPTAGEVSAETPAAGTNVTPKSTVKLTVSSGPCPVKVPTEKGKTVATAKSTLTGKGFTVATHTTTTVGASCHAAGTDNKVVRQTPAGGSTATPGSTVSLYYCSFKTPSKPAGP